MQNWPQMPSDRYMNDVAYKNIVDMMESMIHQCKYSPSEMREAAILASIHYEMHTIRSYHIPITPEIAKHLDALHDFTEGEKRKPENR